MEEVDFDKPDGDPHVELPVKTRKALIIGINYIGTPNVLGGCINDAKAEAQLLIERFGYSEDQVLLLTDDQEDSSKVPNRVNMIAGIEWLMAGVEEGDVRFFHYSGHGSQVADPTGQEADGMNECLCPSDCMSGDPWPDAVILDDYLNDMFFDALPEGVRLTCVYDCCHSATMTDLSVTIGVDDAVLVAEDGGDPSAAGRFLNPPSAVAEALSRQTKENRPKAGVHERELKAPHAKLLWTISGCQDSQTSADATIGGLRRGALTWSLHAALESTEYQITYEDLLTASRKRLKGKYTQIPSMSTTAASNFQCRFLSHML